MSTLRARRATANDVADIARLHAAGVRERGVLDATTRGEAEIGEWLVHRFPLAVVTDDAEVIAFAVMLPMRNTGTGGRVGELLVHVAQARRRRGAARVAVGELTAEARVAGAWKLVAYVLAENAGARALLVAIDFREVGVLEKHVQVDSTWRDVVLCERLLLSSRRSSPAIKVK